MKDPKKTEIRRVLMGRIELGEGGQLVPIPAGEWTRIPSGVADGAGAVFLLGVSRRIRRYDTKDDKDFVMDAARKAMQEIGRALVLREQPKAAACLIRYILTRPAVLTFDYENGIPTLTAYTGRGLTAWISKRRAIRAFERRLPESIPPDRKKRKKEKKKSPRAGDAKQE